MRRFENKSVFITGAGSGIGKETALAFAREGAKVYLNDLPTQQNVQKIKEELINEGVQVELKLGDISNPEQVKDMFKDIENLDILVNNAGVLQEVSMEEITDSDWDAMIKVHLYGTFYCSREAGKLMLHQESGKIINISSDLGQLGCERLAHYSAAKGGIIAFTKALAREWGPKGVLVNSVAPGGTMTPLVERLGPEYAIEEAAKYPLKRLAEPSEIANVILFLASDEALFMTGQIVGVNGGGVMIG
ncbi:SDR family NAD(P)-dependent oxidoreductase [Neobacillus sp. NRS-1170]|uniref:SDR family NAD(P)-dependent oxidoreductase n=1 Tax=Neobacillus sp. NRS-1170 TaxID=3233898 RepID=UPI003D2BF213